MQARALNPLNDPVLTVAQTQAAEQALINGGVSVDALMERAGQGAAEYIWRMAAGQSVTVLCGPGNNGGDGYVIAEVLRARGLSVSVIAPDASRTDAAANACAAFQGNVKHDASGVKGHILVDCLFGSGLTRGLSEENSALLMGLTERHAKIVAIDMPSGVDSDSGAILSPVPVYDLTIALGAWKWAHFMMPAAQYMGALEKVGIGLDVSISDAFPPVLKLTRPQLSSPAPDAHKYTRGLVAIVAGAMPGAAMLAALAARNSGAGYVKLLSDGQDFAAPPDIVIDRSPLAEALTDSRISSLLIGPGLGRDETARKRLDTVLRSAGGGALTLDADALMLLEAAQWPDMKHGNCVMTPHAGELSRLCETFLIPDGQSVFARKVFEVIELGKKTRATLIAKGPDTVLYQHNKGIVVSAPASSWLSVAGTGDVLSGIVAARLASGSDPLAAGSEAVWLHGEAARLAGCAFSALQLVDQLRAAYARCL